MLGSIVSLMPTSLNSIEVVVVCPPTTVEVVGAEVVVERRIGTRSPILILALLLSITRTRGFARVCASDSCLKKSTINEGRRKKIVESLRFLRSFRLTPFGTVVLVALGASVAEIWFWVKFQPSLDPLVRSISRI